jgi:hypothetical protein
MRGWSGNSGASPDDGSWVPWSERGTIRRMKRLGAVIPDERHRAHVQVIAKSEG